MTAHFVKLIFFARADQISTSWASWSPPDGLDMQEEWQAPTVIAAGLLPLPRKTEKALCGTEGVLADVAEVVKVPAPEKYHP